MSNHGSVLSLTKRMLSRYYSSIHDSPNEVQKETNDLAFAIIYLVDRYVDEFREEPWVDIFMSLIDRINEIETRYFDMDDFIAPMWCCIYRICKDSYWLGMLFDRGLSRMSLGRMIFLDYAYLVIAETDYKVLLQYLRWFCLEGKSGVKAVIDLFMKSQGNKDEKLAVLRELYNSPGVRRFPQIPGYLEPYLNDIPVYNQFDYVDKHPANTILDYILFRDLTMTEQLELDL